MCASTSTTYAPSLDREKAFGAAWATDAWASHQHDHHMNKHIVGVVPCPECINRGGGTLIGAVYLCGLVQPCI